MEKIFYFYDISTLAIVF